MQPLHLSALIIFTFASITVTDSFRSSDITTVQSDAEPIIKSSNSPTLEPISQKSSINLNVPDYQHPHQEQSTFRNERRNEPNIRQRSEFRRLQISRNNNRQVRDETRQRVQERSIRMHGRSSTVTRKFTNMQPTESTQNSRGSNGRRVQESERRERVQTPRTSSNDRNRFNIENQTERRLTRSRNEERATRQKLITVQHQGMSSRRVKTQSVDTINRNRVAERREVVDKLRNSSERKMVMARVERKNSPQLQRSGRIDVGNGNQDKSRTQRNVEMQAQHQRREVQTHTLQQRQTESNRRTDYRHTENKENRVQEMTRREDRQDKKKVELQRRNEARVRVQINQRNLESRRINSDRRNENQLKQRMQRNDNRVMSSQIAEHQRRTSFRMDANEQRQQKQANRRETSRHVGNIEHVRENRQNRQSVTREVREINRNRIHQSRKQIAQVHTQARSDTRSALNRRTSRFLVHSGIEHQTRQELNLNRSGKSRYSPITKLNKNTETALYMIRANVLKNDNDNENLLHDESTYTIANESIHEDIHAHCPLKTLPSNRDSSSTTGFTCESNTPGAHFEELRNKLNNKFSKSPENDIGNENMNEKKMLEYSKVPQEFHETYEIQPKGDFNIQNEWYSTISSRTMLTGLASCFLVANLKIHVETI